MRPSRVFVALLALAATSMGGPRATLAEDAASSGPKPLAVEELSSGGVEVSLLELKRTTGDTVTAKWLYKNTGEENKRLPYLMSDGYYLVDAAAKKKYFGVKDSEGKWIAGTAFGSFQGFDLKPGEKFKMWAKFPAPPAATEKVSVYLEGVPPLEDIPLAQ